jgi:hypothetical protein
MPEAAHKGKRDPLVQLHSFKTHIFCKMECRNVIEGIQLHSAPAQLHVIDWYATRFARALASGDHEKRAIHTSKTTSFLTHALTTLPIVRRSASYVQKLSEEQARVSWLRSHLQAATRSRTDTTSAQFRTCFAFNPTGSRACTST